MSDEVTFKARHPGNYENNNVYILGRDAHVHYVVLLMTRTFCRTVHHYNHTACFALYPHGCAATILTCRLACGNQDTDAGRHIWDALQEIPRATGTQLCNANILVSAHGSENVSAFRHIFGFLTQ